MPILPDKINERIEWFESRIAGWAADAPALGLPPLLVTNLAASVAAARDAYKEALNARIAAKAATLGQKIALVTMDDLGGDAIQFIKAFADSQATPAARDAVFQTANVPPPAPPVPAGPPEAPTMVTGDPNADGTVTVRWKGSTASQTFFSIWRRVGNSTTWNQIGSTAAKSWIDSGVPGGTPTVRYYIRAQRNNTVSPASDEAVVNFGVSAAA